MGQHKIIIQIVLDFVVLVCVTFPLLAILLWVEPYHRGYFADDHSLRLPFKEQSISEGVLAGVGFALNVFTIIILECINDKKGRSIGGNILCGASIPSWLWESYRTIGVFSFGAACQQLTSNITKNVIGRLRPHFFDVCNPIPNPDSELNTLGYIQDFTCTNPDFDASRLKDMRLSFPSAHSSFAMYAAVFFICYVQVKGKWRQSKLLRHAIQFLVLIGGWYVGLTRVQEHMHHWSDVTVGFFIGAFYAVTVFVYVLKPKRFNSVWEEPQPPHMLPRPVLAM